VKIDIMAVKTLDSIFLERLDPFPAASGAERKMSVRKHGFLSPCHFFGNLPTSTTN
jgi:hypothetical protein